MFSVTNMGMAFAAATERERMMFFRMGSQLPVAENSMQPTRPRHLDHVQSPRANRQANLQLIPPSPRLLLVSHQWHQVYPRARHQSPRANRRSLLSHLDNQVRALRIVECPHRCHLNLPACLSDHPPCPPKPRQSRQLHPFSQV